MISPQHVKRVWVLGCNFHFLASLDKWDVQIVCTLGVLKSMFLETCRPDFWRADVDFWNVSDKISPPLSNHRVLLSLVHK